MEKLLSSAKTLLHQLCGPTGIHASLSDEGNYRAVFTRDAVMAGILGIWTEDETVMEGLLTTLKHLKHLQGEQGQIASNYTYAPGLTMENGKPQHVSYGTLCPKPDALNWYLYGLALLADHGMLDAREFEESAKAVIALMEAMEYNGKHLLYIPAGGNWADEYPYEGFLLHDQALRILALRTAANVFKQESWLEKAAAIEETVNINLWPNSAQHEKAVHKRLYTELATQEAKRNYFAAGLNPTKYIDCFDLASNVLFSLAGKSASTDKLFDYIEATYLNRGKLPPAFAPTIREEDADWSGIRDFYIYVFKNKPGHYHNGGIWFIWLGWLAHALSKDGRQNAVELLAKLTFEAVEKLGDRFAFEEYLVGEDANDAGSACGTKNMAYSATGLLMIEKALS